MNEIVLSVAFQRQLKKLIKKNPKLKTRIIKTLKWLRTDINYTPLRLHKLSGINNWSVSVTSDIRIIFHLQGKRIFCLRIGTHDEVY